MNTLLIAGTTLLLILSKAADILTTLLRIKSNADEVNPLARNLMNRLGTRKAIFLVGLLSFVIIGLCSYLIWQHQDNLLLLILYVLTGSFVSLIQFAVAHSNWTGRFNVIVRGLIWVKGRIGM